MPRGRPASTAAAERPAIGLRSRGPQKRATTAAENAKRAAFGDLTNAASEKQSLSKQVKKGLSNIVNRSKGSGGVGTTNNATNNKRKSAASAASAAAKKFKLAASLSKTSRSNSNSVLEEDEHLSGESQSLPSSQQEPTNIQLPVEEDDDNDGDESEYQSFDEDENDTVVPAESKSKKFVPPPRPIPPPGVADFDLENWADYLQCSEYAMDAFYYYKSRELMFNVPDYMASQREITEMMRAILVDWLVEVQESFELNHETLYTAVKILDGYMAKKHVPKENLQLIGATACLIACKIDERIPPMLDDFVYVCDDAYTRRQIMAMEREVLLTVGFDLGYPLSYRFLRRYGRVCKVSMPVLTLARYILETSLLEYKFNVETSESILAAAALVLALKISGIDGWVNTLAFYSGYMPMDLYDLVMSLLHMLQQYPKENLKTIRQKYSHRVFHEVALIPLPDTIELTESG